MSEPSCAKAPHAISGFAPEDSRESEENEEEEKEDEEDEEDER
jgi:hypothetical protein